MLNSLTFATHCTLFFFWDHLQEGRINALELLLNSSTILRAYQQASTVASLLVGLRTLLGR